MGIRFRRSIKLGPGVRLNMGKKSAGLSFGGTGFRYSVSTSGRRTTSIGIPGTGLSHVQTTSKRKAVSPVAAGSARQGPAAISPAGLPKPGLFAPAAEKRFYDGLRAYLEGDLPKALTAFEAVVARDARNISDDFFAGLTALGLGDQRKAMEDLEKVVQSEIELPDELMLKYLPHGRALVVISVPITALVTVNVGLSSLGAALVLAELYQSSGQLEAAIGLLQQLSIDLGEDPGLRLSLCDLLYEDGDYDGVIETAAGVVNDSDLNLACLLLKAKALADRGLTSAAQDTLTECLKRTAKRDPDLLRETRYDRALLYEKTGQVGRARKEWEKLFAEDPVYRDVCKKISANADPGGQVQGQDKLSSRVQLPTKVPTPVHCSQCGTKIADGHKFCSVCGAKVVD